MSALGQKQTYRIAHANVCFTSRRRRTCINRQDSGDVYSVTIAIKLSAAARTKTIVNSVAHMVDAPRFPDTDLKAARQL